MKAHRWFAIVGVVFLFSSISTVVHSREVRPHVAAGYAHSVGLKADGTVVATGDNTYGQCNVTGWRLGSPALGPPSEGMFYLIPSKRGSAAVIYLE